MKKYVSFLSLIMALSFSASVHGKSFPDKGVYLGVGGSYAFENFDTDRLDAQLDRSVNFDNSLGFNAKAGYHFNSWFGLEFNFDHYPEFEADEFSTTLISEVSVEVTTYMAVAKISDTFYSTKPFLVMGLGYMDYEADIDTPDVTGSFSRSESESDACVKLGMGMDFTMNQNMSIGIEGSYVIGVDDLEDIRYVSFTLGAAYHF
jgi:opacity protein-like surface antigen